MAKLRKDVQSVIIHFPVQEATEYAIGDEIQTGETDSDTEVIDYISIDYMPSGLVDIRFKTSGYRDPEFEDHANGDTFKLIVGHYTVDITYSFTEVEN